MLEQEQWPGVKELLIFPNLEIIFKFIGAIAGVMLQKTNFGSRLAVELFSKIEFFLCIVTS